MKCQTEEGIVNVYRYLRAHEHRSKSGRVLADGEIISCLRKTILNNTDYLEQSLMSSKTTSAAISVTLPILTPPSPIKLSRDQLQMRRAEIKRICNDNQFNDIVKANQKSFTPSPLSTPYSSGTVVTPMPRLSFAQQ